MYYVLTLIMSRQARPLGESITMSCFHSCVKFFVSMSQGFRGAVHYAELRSEMTAQQDSDACLEAAACLPLGGHSVWASLPPLPAGKSDECT